MIFSFADCALDSDRHELTRAGDPVHVEPQVFTLLVLLVESGGAVVSRDDMIEAVWDGRIVSEATISARIRAARVAVGDGGGDQKIIRTVPKVGLQMVVPVTAVAAVEAGAAETVPVSVAADSPAPVRPRVRVRMTTSADGSGIAWTEEGEGPALLRAGHWLTHLEKDRVSPIWGAYLDRMGRGRRLIRYDLRGTGMSEQDCGPITLDAFVEDMATVVEAAGLDRFDVFAASQSLSHTIMYNAIHPGRIRRIFSMGGFAEGMRVRGGAAGQTMADAHATLLKHGWGQPEGGLMRSFTTTYAPAASHDQLSAIVDLQLASATADRAIEVRDVIARTDVKDLLAECRVPVYLVHSQNDAMHPYSQAQLLARMLPDAQLHPVQTLNHIFMPDEPDFTEMMDALDAFLAED